MEFRRVLFRSELRKVHQYNVFCTFAPAQHAFAEMLDAEPEHYEQLGAFYEAKRDRFREQLLGTKFRPLPVPGGYFQLVDYSAISDLDDFEFCRWLTIEKGVTAIPLSPFYRSEEHTSELQSLMRISYAVFCLKKKKPNTQDPVEITTIYTLDKHKKN